MGKEFMEVSLKSFQTVLQICPDLIFIAFIQMSLLMIGTLAGSTPSLFHMSEIPIRVKDWWITRTLLPFGSNTTAIPLFRVVLKAPLWAVKFGSSMIAFGGPILLLICNSTIRNLLIDGCGKFTFLGLTEVSQ